MGRRNPDRYTDADWKLAGRTVGAIIANRWLVYTECDLCQLRIQADLKRIARERGNNFVLWDDQQLVDEWGARGMLRSGCGHTGPMQTWP